MRENVGRIDRIVRTIAGTGLVTLGAVALQRGWLSGVFGIVTGALALESALTRVCPVNAMLGLDTRSATERISDFRGDVNEQTERITHEYLEPDMTAGFKSADA